MPRASVNRIGFVLFAVTLAAGCSRQATSVSAGGPDWFVDRAEEAGIQFEYVNGMSGKFYFPEMLPGGVGLLDYDNDGDLDIYLVQGRMLDEGKALSLPDKLKGRLYRNDLEVKPDRSRTLRFSDVTDQSGIDARAYGMGVAAGDFNNDGCVDLYLTNVGRNALYRNNCNGTFTDVSKQSGTDGSGWSVSAAFVDYDRDGWLDLYVGHYVQWDIKSELTCLGVTGVRDYCRPVDYRAERDRLYHNNRDATFTDVTATALKGGAFGSALGVSTADFNNDGWIDLYVANDGRENVLWMNQHDGTFRNMALLSGTALSAEGKPEGSMGVDAGDFDNDGDDDLFLTNLPAEGSDLYVNNGSGLFEDLSGASGLGPASLGYTGFGTAWFDFDNDGWLDIFAVNGAVVAIKGREDQPFPYAERKLLFRNLRDGRFEDVTRRAASVFESAEVSRGAAFGDIDNDGDVDVLVGTINGPVRLLINTVGDRHHWLGLRLVGTAAPRDMLGARVRIIRTNGPHLWRRARADGSYASANDPRVVVGLGESAEAPTVRVRWPSGNVEEWRSVAIDRWTTLKEGTGGR